MESTQFGDVEELSVPRLPECEGGTGGWIFIFLLLNSFGCCVDLCVCVCVSVRECGTLYKGK